MEAKDIINKVLIHTGLNAKSFSAKIGLNRPQAIYDIQKCKTKSISFNMADKILSVFSDFNRVWLLTGEGEMLIKDHNIYQSSNNNSGIINTGHAGGHIANISVPENMRTKIINNYGIKASYEPVLNQESQQTLAYLENQVKELQQELASLHRKYIKLLEEKAGFNFK